MFGARIRVHLSDDWTAELGQYDIRGDVYTATLHERQYTALYRFRGNNIDKAVELAESADYFKSVEVIDRGTNGSASYAIVLTLAQFLEPTPYTIMLENDYMPLDPTILQNGYEFFDLFIRDRDRLAELVDRLGSVGDVGIDRVVSDIEMVFTPSPVTWGSLEELLTDRQREVIVVAYELGYFSVPREATLSDIAAHIDIEKSTVGEHLRRGMGHIGKILAERESP
ncbi:Predicted DNA binding protein, contains HTH domain [Halogranum rubrum]|uniref:Predicted DNA binding protein, contains HTH domain n=1 Tax=Halogranum rubrum TaxID=553466 RepID=A0A1I4HV34_9EURY|nr:helix-turn-helix domain-containing protein [Halogranum rubrum]SFL46012.1 Predicted DNA binding protein, contains HTH domain [Halogranum rubrum]